MPGSVREEEPGTASGTPPAEPVGPAAPEGYAVPPFTPPTRQKALEWLAVLGAAGIDAIPVREAGGWLKGKSTIAVLDTDTMDVEIIELS